MTNVKSMKADSTLIATVDWEIVSPSLQSLIRANEIRYDTELKGCLNCTEFTWHLYLVNDGSIRLTLDGLTSTELRFPTIYYDLKFGRQFETPYECRKGALSSLNNGKDYSYGSINILTIPLYDFENLSHYIADDKLVISLQLYTFFGCNDPTDVNEIEFFWRASALNDALINDFANLLKEPKHSDVTINCAGGALKAHKCILSARSKVFSEIFDTTASEVTITDVDVSVMKLVLKFIYTGEVDLSESNLQEVLLCAEKYHLSELKTLCLKLIAEQEDALYDLQILKNTGGQK